MFFKICFLENFAILTRKHLCWSFFLIKFQALRLFLYNTTSGCFRYYWNYIKVPATNIKYFISSRGDLSEAVVQRCSVKKVFLEISPFSSVFIVDFEPLNVSLVNNFFFLTRYFGDMHLLIYKNSNDVYIFVVTSQFSK